MSEQPGEHPHVSVIIPAYNQAAYLREAIDSVLAQTYRDFEIIVVDDESTDETAEIARSYGEPVRYVWQQNKGLAGARNSGIRQARGELVGLLDSDDLWLPAFLEKMVAFAGNHPRASVFYCGTYFVDSHANRLPQTNDARLLPADQMLPTLLRYNFLSTCTILLRKADVEKAGLFDESFRQVEDWELWLRMLRGGYQFQGISERLASYRLHDHTLTRDPGKMHVAVLRMVAKHFGPDDGDYLAWEPEKRRAYGGAYRYQVITSLLYRQDWHACASALRIALLVDPSLMDDAAMFYELALGTQPQGYRGSGRNLDLHQNAENVHAALDSAFASPMPPALARLRRPAFARAYHALGQVAYNLGYPGLSRRYWLRSMRYQTSKVAEMRLLSMIARSLLGKESMQRLRRLRRGLL